MAGLKYPSRLAELASEARLRTDRYVIELPNAVPRMHWAAILVAEAILPPRGWLFSTRLGDLHRGRLVIASPKDDLHLHAPARAIPSPILHLRG